MGQIPLESIAKFNVSQRDFRSGNCLEQQWCCGGFSPDGKTLASGSWDNNIRLWNLNLYFLFLQDGKSTPLFFAFAEGAEFFWQAKRQGLEFKYGFPPNLYPQDGYYFKYDPKYRPLLNPPKPGQDKFDQILEWAREQVR